MQHRLLPFVRSGALVGALCGLLLLAGCTLFNGGSSSTAKSLSDLGWCDTNQSPRFQDDSTPSQPIISSWSNVKDQLGFTVYLPSSLPKGSCLALAGGSIHDPVYGGHLDVTYLLPGTQGQVPLAFSEAPKRSGMSDSVQCVQSPQDSATNICLGAIDGTSVTIASRQSASQLQSVFSSLQSNVNWVPSGTTTAPAATNTPTTSPNASPTSTPKS
ncbi:MAG TPA: hypothetical protein VF120_09670 [Ktedonobacterales bacterium]